MNKQDDKNPSNSFCYSFQSGIIINQSFLSTVVQVLDKVRTLCKEYELSILPSKITVAELHGYLVVNSVNNMSNNGTALFGEFSTALDELRTKIFEFRELEEEYRKLESVLQKNETEIRKHIGIEQQFRLYIDTLKAQFEESENQKGELLENSKTMIEQFKSENQRLISKLKEVERNLGINISQPQENRKQKQRLLNKNKDRIKSEHCSSLHIRHTRNHTQNNFISPLKDRIREQDFRIDFSERFENSKKKKTDLKKKQNYTVMAYMGHQRKKGSKEKTQFKKAQVSQSNKKKVNFGSMIKSNDKDHNVREFNSIYSLEID